MLHLIYFCSVGGLLVNKSIGIMCNFQELFVEVPDQPSQANRKGVYLGRWKDIPIVVKMLTNGYPPEFRNFDDFVCLKATGKRHCNVSAAITSDYIMEDKDLLSPDHLLSAWKISYNQSGPLALTYVGFCELCFAITCKIETHSHTCNLLHSLQHSKTYNYVMCQLY